MDDYYSLLGIDADASVDDIRGAYRVRKDGLDTASDAGKADAAKLNKAWNVLSDPYQRGRYDAQRTAAADSDAPGSDDADDQAASSSNGSGPKGLRASAKNSRQERQRSVRDARAERLKQAATISAPAGTHFPKPKQRIIAMVIDLLVLIVLVSGSQVAAQAIAKSQKPAIVKQVNSLNDQITAENKVKSDADTAVSNDKKANDTAKQATDQKASDDEKAKITTLTKQRDDAASKLNPYFLGSLVVAFFLGFLYLAIPSAMTGRTLGKRFQHLKTLREDGSPLGARGAVIRFGLLVLVTFTLYLLLQQFAAILVLFGVTMWLRNANMQGLHDRFAHTIVVSDAAD
jgi:curved DNA-binding protein CbpA